MLPDQKPVNVFTDAELQALDLPEDPEARALALLVYDAAVAALDSQLYANGKREIDTGGCRPFYSTQEWRDRGEDYGCESALIICHDGGDFAPLCNYSYEAYEPMERFRVELEKRGYWIEPCTCWYTAVYRLGT